MFISLITFTFIINNCYRNTGGWEGDWGGLDQPETSDRVRETQEDYKVRPSEHLFCFKKFLKSNRFLVASHCLFL